MNDIDRILLSTYHKSDTAWKVSKYGVISGPYFPVFVLNTNLFSRNTGKYGPEITPYLDTFHAVWVTQSIQIQKRLAVAVRKTVKIRKCYNRICCLLKASPVWKQYLSENFFFEKSFL